MGFNHPTLKRTPGIRGVRDPPKTGGEFGHALDYIDNRHFLYIESTMDVYQKNKLIFIIPKTGYLCSGIDSALLLLNLNFI